MVAPNINLDLPDAIMWDVAPEFMMTFPLKGARLTEGFERYERLSGLETFWCMLDPSGTVQLKRLTKDHDLT